MQTMKIPAMLATAVLALSPFVASADTAAKTETIKTELSESKATEQAERPAEAKARSSDAAMREEARILMKDAQATASKAAPGTVQSGELEREHGKLIYSFDIRNEKGSITEVNVNAINGKIIDMQVENQAKEAAEKVQEMTENK